MKEVREPRRQPSITPVPKSGVLAAVRRSVSPSRAAGPSESTPKSSSSSFSVWPSTLLIGGVDIDAVIASVPEHYAMKGMFFSALSTPAGERFAGMVSMLSCPPRRGVYLPFMDYPTRDFLRLFDAVARFSHPSWNTREAYRRLARQQLATLVQSAAGRLAMNLAADPGAALLRYTSSFGSLVKGPAMQARQEGSSVMRIDLVGDHGIPEVSLGIFEALVMGFGATPMITVNIYAADAVEFLISW